MCIQASTNWDGGQDFPYTRLVNVEMVLHGLPELVYISINRALSLSNFCIGDCITSSFYVEITIAVRKKNCATSLGT